MPQILYYNFPMLKLTELQGADIRQVKTDLEEAGFKNITIKLHPSFERVGSKQDPLFQQIWPRLRVAVTFDVLAPLPDQEPPK